jgi:diguanylate cyclase (GGDEF)-like protein
MGRRQRRSRTIAGVRPIGAMAPPTRTGYAFTDPLGAAIGVQGRPPTWLARRALMALYGIGSATLGVTLLTPDSDTSDHGGLAAVALLMLLLAIVLKLWREPAPLALLACFPLGTLEVTALVAVAKPVALIPMFYIWPLVLAAYFLQRREIIAMFVLTAVSFAVALLGWVAPDARMIQWVSVMVATAVLTGLVIALKEGLATTLTRLNVLATRDPLTGALNRRAFAEALDTAVARAARGDGTCSVAILDVDHFKAINDAFGHAAGDLALQRLTTVVESRMRRGDVVGRLGGEEFGIVLDGTDAPGAEAYGESLRAAFAVSAADPAIPAFTVSIGVAELADGDATSERMLIAADHALYAAKAAGRDRVMRAPAAPARAA